jgi:DNA-binding transcriptional LysR family regulator
MDIEIRLLRSALAVAEHLNFRLAANSLHLSQPSLTRNIQNLEAMVGSRIFDRDRGHVEVTEAGGIFLEFARDVLSSSSDLMREMKLVKGLEKGELQVGVGTYPSTMFVDRAIGLMIREHPTARLRIANDNWTNLIPLLRSRDLDLAVIQTSTTAADPEYHVTPLTTRQGYLAVRRGHPLVKHKSPLTMNDVLHYPFVSVSRLPPTVSRALVNAAASGDNPVSPAMKTFPSIACESVTMMRNIVLESDAVAILPLIILLPDLKSKAIAVLPLFSPILRAEFGIVRLARRSLSPLGQLFVKKLQEVDAEVAALEEKEGKKLVVAHSRRKPRANK